MNKLKQKIIAKEKIIGMYVQLCDPAIARIAGLSGYDYVWVDLEYSCMSYETLQSHIIALKSTGTPVIVRVPQDDLTATKKVCEIGVDGIIFPMVRTAEEADRLIGYTLYPPHGNRGFGPMGAIDWGIKNVKNYVGETVGEMCRFIQIEHKDTIENLDEIIKNEYIDGYIFGANDLSGSYNMLGDVFSDKITTIIKETTERLHKNGKYVGIASGGNNDEIIGHWCSFGAEMIASGADFDFIRDAAIANRERLERLHKFK